MSLLFGLAALVAGLSVAAYVLVRVSPAALAGGIRIAGPVLLGLAGGALLLLGRAGLGGMLLSGALAWYSSSAISRSRRRSTGRRSTVRTAALEMELDHDSGSLNGHVLAGRHEGRILDEMSREELISLIAELSGDRESVQLLETYLDGRFAGWRDDAQPDADAREGVPPRPGAMTKQEAYDILGLQPGAGAADIRKAHRRLMQRLHPDLGGTSSLAARINEAKDVLLSDHG